ncbi:MAG: oxidoreductase [Bacteroidetes bacterium GWF2_38_335]|nr:MAG: oxidoreductase [Bacteroidetes bacterium GWF2_38_335]OFY77407.1 MAG: oxidoreductase [Bacteroidetes bacterium RIFOXYA12_FULL_38_20]HBS87305.1 oxidoreductase [Bacteroidales bacterium]
MKPEINQIPDYELVDCGNFEKLERFGQYFLIRPESQAIWKKRMDEKEWKNIAHAHYKREAQKNSYRSGDPGNGGWSFYKKMPENWTISCPLPKGDFKMKLSLTTFGHVGIFPEQLSNWTFIYNAVKSSEVQSPKVLNAFAYTGGASLVAKAAGADVTHLDAVKQIVNWGKENMTLSGLNDIRWIVDDALKFLRREEKRGKIYNGIILDPPAYGRGPNGERWILDEGINDVLDACSKILSAKDRFLVLNLYSLGYSPLIANNLVESYFQCANREFGESFLSSKTGIDLPLGVYVRFKD